MTYEYSAELVRVIDGDTVVLRVTREYDFGFYIRHTHTYENSFRLMGIDTPEIRGVNADLIAGKAAKARLEELLSLGPISITTYKPDKYGRWLADIYVTLDEDGTTVRKNINETLVTEGFAVRY